MSDFGVQPSGFVKKPLSVIKSGLESGLRGKYGDSFDVSTESPAGQVIGVAANEFAELWDAAEDSYAANTADGSTGVSLDNVCALTGTKKNPATFSKATVTLHGTPSAVIAARTFSVAGTGAKFTMDADATIGGGGTVDVACTANVAGPTIATAGTLTVIDNPAVGLDTVTNAEDAEVGSALETEAALRLRRESELRASGKAAIEPVREAVLALEDADGDHIVASCIVFSNDEDTTDGDGVPPHSINVLATCDTGDEIDQAVAEAIFESKAGGIQAYGGTVITVTDDQGETHDIGFDRPDELNVYCRFDIIIDPDTYPVDGDDQFKAAVVAFGAVALTTGRDAVASALGAQGFRVTGVLDSPAAKIGLAPSPTLTTTIAVTKRQIARLDTGRITIFKTNGTP
jgi:hypothetical protein